jgi:acetyltransferase-like isoleucine patch superfamily enzyme
MGLDRFVSLVMKRVRGREEGISPGIKSTEALSNMLQKGAMAYLRGLCVKPFLGAARGSFFLGRGVTILNKRKLRLGAGVYIGNYSYLDCLSVSGVTLGHSVTIREGCWLQLTSSYAHPGASITIGNNVYIGPRMTLGAAAPIVIGNRCQFGANISLVAENHKYAGEGDIFAQGTTRQGILIGDDVWVGNGAIILDGVTIGDGVVIGAGTVVTKSIPSRSVVVGVPGRVIKTR